MKTQEVKADGYPTEYGLNQIRQWRVGTKADICNRKAVEAFIDLIESMWWAADWGFTKRLWRGKIRLYLSTGGWSGNEEIIAEMKKTFFWMFYWVSSRRGGHYVFEVGIKKGEGKQACHTKSKSLTTPTASASTAGTRTSAVRRGRKSSRKHRTVRS